MKNISDIDKNFVVSNLVKRDGVKFWNVLEKPFCLYGVFYENGMFRRMPEKIAETVSEGVFRLHTNTAGGRVRFRTNSRYIAISAIMNSAHKFSHCAFTATIGFDMYVDGIYTKTFVPPVDITVGYDSDFEFPEKSMRQITINFPLYSNVEHLYVGLDEDCVLEEPFPYMNEEPIVYYGSSITQGGCASRPGMSYEAIISRRFNCDYINLGFSGNAKAEDEMIDYVKNLKMSLFVYDYDYNTPNAEHLLATHEKMFVAIRKAHLDIPIIIMSRPKAILSDDELYRRSIIETTYKNAIASGDNHVYFLDGPTLMQLCGVEGSVDNCHPTDFGFASMAMTLGNFIEENNLLKR